MNVQTRSDIGFDLLQINLYRFMNYMTPVTFNFNAPYIVIAGSTGSGKTTILEALTFTLFGRSSRLDLPMVKIEDICGKKGYVTCIFMSGKNRIRIKRGRDNQGKSYLELFINKERVVGKIPDLNEKIRSTILRMNYQAFINSTIIRQDEMKALGSKSSTKRLQTLQNLFRLDIFEKAINEAQNRLVAVLARRNTLEGQLQEKESRLNKLDKIEPELKALKTHLEVKRQDLQNLIQKIEKLEKEEVEKQNIHERYQTLQSKVRDAQERLEGKEESLMALQTEMEKFKKIKKKLTEIQKQVEVMRKLKDEINSLESTKKEFELMEKHLKTLIKKKQELENSLKSEMIEKRKKMKNERERINNLDTTIDHETAFKLLNQEGRLLERIQRISKEKTWNLHEKLIQEIHEEQVQAREDLRKLSDKKEKITKDSFVLSEKRERVSEMEEEIKVLNDRLKTDMDINEGEIQVEKKKLEQLGFSQAKQQHLDTLRSKFEINKELEINYKKLKQEFEEKTDPVGQIKVIRDENKELTSEIKRIKDKLKDYPKFKQEYEKLISSLNKKRKEERSLNDIVVRTDQQIKGIAQEIVELKKLKPEIIMLKADLKTLIKEEDILQKLKTEVFHTTGAPFYAITKILPRLGRRASLILSELTNQRFSHIQLQKVEKGKGMGFEIILKVPDGFRDIATFSGGERTQINAALRLAISEEISALEHHGLRDFDKKTLFIDEGDLGALDTLEAQSAFVKKLFSLSNQFKIILITHIQEIADQFPHSINITRDSYGRSIKGDETKSP